MIKALGLLSGGLDSMLAAAVLKEQAIDVTGISFVTPFFGSRNAQKAVRELGIPLIVKDITVDHMDMLLNPKHGYGSRMNPCIDCHALMLKKAGEIMKKEGFDFIFTGEVLGERPMSQNKVSLGIVAKESGYADYILRPLSAKLLPETKPEREKKVDRNRLLDISGRQRKRQLDLARNYNFKEFPTPASGCLLTDPGFSARLKDLLLIKEKPEPEDIELLKVGRHVKLAKDKKIIIGRNEKDNGDIGNLSHGEYLLFAPEGVRGPYCLVPRKLDEGLLDKAMEICASYCSAGEGDEVVFGARDRENRINIKTIHSKANRPKEFVGS